MDIKQRRGIAVGRNRVKTGEKIHRSPEEMIMLRAKGSDLDMTGFYRDHATRAPPQFVYPLYSCYHKSTEFANLHVWGSGQYSLQGPCMKHGIELVRLGLNDSGGLYLLKEIEAF